MRETLSALALLLGVYLYLDKFLFGGRLGGLFLTGWRELLRIPSRSLRGKGGSPAVQAPAPDPDPVNLVERKAYDSGHKVPVGDKREETEPKAPQSDTFALPEGDSTAPELQEWRDPSFGPQPRKGLAAERWEDPEFSGRFIQRDDESGETDILPAVDPEQVRREVAASLQGVLEEQARDEFRPTEEELSELGHFDMDAFR